MQWVAENGILLTNYYARKPDAHVELRPLKLTPD